MNRLKKYWPALLVVAILAIGAAWVLWLNKETTLVDLQKQYLFAKTEAGRDKVIDRLEEYYLNLPIPDSISQRVDDEVQKLLNTTKIDLAGYSDKILEEPTANALENNLKGLLRIAMIARAREEMKIFQELMSKAKKMANIVDGGTQAVYWVPFVDVVSAFTKENAFAWLKAKRSAAICRELIDSNYLEAEEYGSLALKSLQQARDERIRLEITQRFQIILYLYRGMFDLSMALADRSAGDPNNANDHLRATGIMFYKGEALRQSGQIKAALEVFQKVDQNAEKYKEISSMLWYKKNGLLNIALLCMQLGQFEKALSVCKEIEQLNLKPLEEMQLHNTKGRVHQSLGNYEKADSFYTEALKLAESENVIFNMLSYLHNLGWMYYELTDYDRALHYLYRKNTVLDKFNPENHQSRINLIIEIAKIMARKNRFESVDSLLYEARGLIDNLGKLPLRNADLLVTLGRFNLEIGKTKEALKNFQEAESICEKNSLLRMSVSIKINIAECMILLKRYPDARRKLSKALALAEKIDDAERVVDSLALLSNIEFEEGNIKKAVEISNSFIKKIEELSSRFSNVAQLTAFRQKTYGYMKNAVAYEIQYGRIDSAFVKFDYAKARSLKYGTNLLNSMDIDTIKSRLDAQSLIIDYMVTQDTLYAFVLHQDSLQLFRKKIDIKKLRKIVNKYKGTLEESATILGPYDREAHNNLFETATTSGQNLFQELMGWPCLESRLKDIEELYIIPDAFLFDVPFTTVVMDTTNLVTFLATEAAVVYLPSTSFLHSSKKNSNNANLTNKKVLISANPSFPGVRDFILNLKTAFPLAEELKVSKNSSKQELLDKIKGDYEIYIIIGHGIANVEFPELSYIEFTVTDSAASISNTIQITMADLEGIKWPGAEMVMLIGCETAGGKLYSGTGISGIQQSFISLGAKTVLASRWKIDAAQAIPQMQEFIKVWKTSLNPVMALKVVQLNSIQNLYNDPYYELPHPYFWGSYSLFTAMN